VRLPRALAWLARWRRSAPAPTLRLYTKADCPLCDAMKAELARARVEPRPELELVDIERDPELRARYGLSVPVLEIGGRAAFKGRLTAAEFERKYARRAAEIRAEASRDAAGRRESGHD
jgi:glutaredoxin